MSRKREFADVQVCGWCRRERPVWTYDGNDKPLCRDCDAKFMADMTGVDSREFDGEDDDEWR